MEFNSLCIAPDEPELTELLDTEEDHVGKCDVIGVNSSSSSND